MGKSRAFTAATFGGNKTPHSSRTLRDREKLIQEHILRVFPRLNSHDAGSVAKKICKLSRVAESLVGLKLIKELEILAFETSWALLIKRKQFVSLEAIKLLAKTPDRLNRFPLGAITGHTENFIVSSSLFPELSQRLKSRSDKPQIFVNRQLEALTIDGVSKKNKRGRKRGSPWAQALAFQDFGTDELPLNLRRAARELAEKEGITPKEALAKLEVSAKLRDKG